MRQRKTLDSSWEVTPDTKGPARVDSESPEPPATGWQPVVVPGFWQPQLTGQARSTGAAWYRHVVELDNGWFELGELVLSFGGVQHFCQGWLNGTYLGEHEGGHLPFDWTIAGAARPGPNELVIRAVSPNSDRQRFPDFPFEETLHGKQSWYGPTGGIWQDVVLEARHPTSVVDLRVRPDAATSTIEVEASVDGADEATLTIEVLDSDNRLLHQVEGVAPGQSVVIDVSSDDVRRWTLDDPVLHRVRASLVADGAVLDVVEKRFGFRTFETSGGRFFLNDEPLVLRGVLDQDYHDGSGRSPSRSELRHRFLQAKEMGFNLVRCHIKVPDPAYLDAADEVGILVWCELPTVTRLTSAARNRIERTIDGMIKRDFHHPSVIIWGIANEAWGYDLGGNAEHRAWLHHQFHRVKAIAGDRLVVDNSPCTPNFHIESDIDDYHFYAVIPEMRERWDSFLDAFARRDAFTYSPHGDAVRRGDEPLVVSEFGAWGLPEPSDGELDEPWWAESGQEWGEGVAYVHGAEQRCSLWHLDDVFGNWSDLCRAAQDRQYGTLRYQIESMRSRPEIAGYVLTELGDVHWEANGLIDMSGRLRSFADRMVGVNGDLCAIVKLDQPVVWSGEPIGVGAVAVNGSQPARDSVLELALDDCMSPIVSKRADLQALDHLEIESMSVQAPVTAVPLEVAAHATLTRAGEHVGSAHRPLLVLPRETPSSSSGPLSIIHAPLANRFRALGYDVTDQRNSVLLRVAHHLDQDDQDHIRNGGRVLLLADEVGALGDGFGEFPAVQLRPWNKALFGGGEWISAFSWLRRSGHFADLPGGPMMDEAFEGLTPNVVITGLPPAHFDCDVIAGVFVGWIHQVRATIARHRAGLGALTISTLRLAEGPPGTDPMATWLLHRLIDTAQEHP